MRYPAVIAWPKDWQDKGPKGLWGDYFRLYDGENAEDKPHAGSRQFYDEHRQDMDEGAEVFQPSRFKPEVHSSALQFLMD